MIVVNGGNMNIVQTVIDEFIKSLPQQYHYQFSMATYLKHSQYSIQVYSRDVMVYCFIASGHTVEEMMQDFDRERKRYELTQT